MAEDSSRVTNFGPAEQVTLENSTPDSAWSTRPIAESITDAMNKAPMGALAEITYAVLARRMKMLLDPSSPLGSILPSSFVHTAVQFRALNPNPISETGRVPAAMANQGSGTAGYQAKVWGPNKEERLPHTVPMPVEQVPYAMGQNAGSLPNAGLLIAKLYADLQSHVPVVLFNITNKNYVPMNIGGQSTSRRFWQNGKVVTELVYRATMTVEASLVTNDDESAANLQAVVEATFGTLRDHIGTGAMVSGSSWQLTLPTRLTPSSINEVDAPWSQGDDKGAKLYTSTVTLEDMSFECVCYVGKAMTMLLSDDLIAAGAGEPTSLSVPGESGDLSLPLRLRLGAPQRLIVTGAPLTADVTVSQSKRVLEIRQPSQTTGVYEVIPRRTGEATIRLYDTGMTVNSQLVDTPTARTGAPLVERKVIVTAV